MRKTKTQKGITLIALIITVIVLLILAAVTINEIKGDGIIAYAINARKEDLKAKRLEEARLLEYEYELEKAEGTTSEVSYAHYAVEKLYGVEIADKVNYQAPAALNYDGGWQVLGVENGQLLLLSDKAIGTLTLEGETGYTTGVSLLNGMCDDYADLNIATSGRSIKVEDVDSLTGYDPNVNSGYKGEIFEYGTTTTWTKKDGKIVFETSTGIKGVSGQNGVDFDYKKLGATTALAEGESDTTLSNYYDYHLHHVGGAPTDSEAYKMLDKADCWLANQCAMNRYDVSYGIRSIAWNGNWNVIGRPRFCSSGKDPAAAVTYNVRAVVALKLDVELTQLADGSYDVK